MTTWNELFSPVAQAAGGLEPRPQQEVLGQAVIDTLDAPGTVLLGNAPTGSGKSFSTLVPVIDYVKKHKNPVIFSVTTLALQDQIGKKDLPFLSKVFGGFTYAILKGRSQYLCLNHMAQMSKFNPQLNSMYKRCDGHAFDTGERPEVERLIGKLDDREWKLMCGDAKRCAEDKCSAQVCYGAKARERAMDKDIVVVNHSVLIANQESLRLGGGFLGKDGQYSVLVVDEAHELENSIIGFLSEKINSYELNQWTSTIIKGIEKALEKNLTHINGRTYINSLQEIATCFDFLVEFYHQIAEFENREWDQESVKVTKKVISQRAPKELKAMAKRFSDEILDQLYNSLLDLHALHGELKKAIKTGQDQQEEGLRDISKAKNKSLALYEAMSKVFEACETSQGYAMDYGTPYGIILNGYFNKDGDAKGSIFVTPLEVSKYCTEMFRDKTCVFVSATLKDLSGDPDNKFKYFIKSMGLENREVEELDLEAVFDYAQQQLVYLPNKAYKMGSRRIKGVKNSLDEMYDLIMAAKGRTLVLFTSNAELQEAKEFLDGNIPYPLYAQGGDLDKQELVDAFMSETDSVLLGSKSFFTGVDFHGEACSLVILAKYPNPRFDDLCRLRLNWWTKNGYKDWYEREALSVFQQGAGRLIRKGTDHGVVALLDKRSIDPKERIFASVGKGVSAMGSAVTQDIDDIYSFLGGTK